jgi:hypothetical protein
MPKVNLSGMNVEALMERHWLNVEPCLRSSWRRFTGLAAKGLLAGGVGQAD